MPAAAVIPAPIAYLNVVAVKKLVVGFWSEVGFAPTRCRVAVVLLYSQPTGNSPGHLIGVWFNVRKDVGDTRAETVGIVCV